MIGGALFKLAARPIYSKALLRQSQFLFCSKQNELMQQVEGKIFEILRSAAKCDQSKLSRQATFEQLGFDSLDSVELVVAMEENLGVDIPNE